MDTAGDADARRVKAAGALPKTRTGMDDPPWGLRFPMDSQYRSPVLGHLVVWETALSGYQPISPVPLRVPLRFPPLDLCEPPR